MKCPACKKKIMDGMESCPFCGIQLIEEPVIFVDIPEIEKIEAESSKKEMHVKPLSPLTPLTSVTKEGETAADEVITPFKSISEATPVVPKEEKERVIIQDQEEKKDISDTVLVMQEDETEEFVSVPAEEMDPYYSPTAPEVEDAWPASPAAMVVKVATAVVFVASVVLYAIYIL